MTVLRRRLLFAPIKLSSVIKHFSELEHVLAFYTLAREYLQEDADKMMAKEHGKAAEEFASLFSKRYFPISVNRGYYGGSILKSITDNVAVEWFGLRAWQYDSMYGYVPPARLLASAICVCPQRSGSRIPVMEKFDALVKIPAGPGGKLVPVNGYPLKQVNQLLEDSPYPGLLLWCQWLFSKTGNDWLDKHGESPNWSRRTVNRLARHWVLYPELNRQMTEFNKWLEVDVSNRSVEVLKYIKRRPKTLIEVFGENK